MIMKDYDYSDVLNEDCIACWFFSTTTKSKQEWENLCSKINIEIQENTSTYIWHKEYFHVMEPLSGNIQDLPSHLFSSTNFGDNIEDEWFIVYLIKTISIKHEDLIIHVKDNDGDFLLIEAADYLPDWANPDTTHNRVFIYRGNLHIIPPSILSVGDDLHIGDAVKLIIQYPDETRASPEIQNTIFKRIDHYPNKIDTNFHHAIVNIPVDLAALLTLDPALISPIVNTYCHHDVIDAKCCTTVENKDWILCKVKFTKFQYSMLINSKLIRSKMCHISDKADKKITLGFKLACGYLMIINKSSGDIFASKNYVKFMDNLKSKGYFKENIEGSREYSKLLESANKYYVSMECPESKTVNDFISKILSSKNFLDMKDRLAEGNVNIEEEDSDDWLTIEPEQLTDLLNTRYSIKKHKITPENMTANINSFLNKKSDFEGIEIPDRNGDCKIDFKPDLFAETLKKMLNFETPGSEHSESVEDFGFTDDESLEEGNQGSMEFETSDVDEELKETLTSDIINTDKQQASYTNLIKSMKEEEGFRGPSSNLLSSMGIRKMDVLDSDDDSD